MTAPVGVALVHHPVLDKNSAVVTTAVTNLDIHDIARACRTYGIRRYYVVTPVPEQQHLVRRVMAHWTEGAGALYNPKRREALSTVMVVSALEDARADMADSFGSPVRVVGTGARGTATTSYGEMSSAIHARGAPFLLVFGTGWGLTAQIMSHADYVLPPITGGGDYNHLSVRSAVAVILDRLFGDR